MTGITTQTHDTSSYFIPMQVMPLILSETLYVHVCTNHSTISDAEYAVKLPYASVTLNAKASQHMMTECLMQS